MYPEQLITPMRQELTRLGVEELRTAADVEAVFANQQGTLLLVVNSMCGCAARNARPAIASALQHAVRPERAVTVFAGQDAEATARARTYIVGYPPSSPCIALFRDGSLVFMIERSGIEGRSAEAIAKDLEAAFDEFCSGSGASL